MTTVTLLSAASYFALVCVVLAMLLALMLGIRFGSQIYFEAALIIALLGFVSTIALAKFLMRGEVIE